MFIFRPNYNIPFTEEILLFQVNDIFLRRLQSKEIRLQNVFKLGDRLAFRVVWKAKDAIGKFSASRLLFYFTLESPGQSIIQHPRVSCAVAVRLSGAIMCSSCSSFYGRSMPCGMACCSVCVCRSLWFPDSPPCSRQQEEGLPAHGHLQSPAREQDAPTGRSAQRPRHSGRRGECRGEG